MPTALGLRPIIVTGPTGVGKSQFAVELAEKVSGEVIGADAFQVYDGLGILTAQPGEDLRDRVPHHLIGTVPVTDSFDVARFAAAARSVMNEIVARNRVPVIVGGTGLYLKALTHGLADLPPPEPELREKIGTMTLVEALTQLNEMDPAASESIDVRNPARVRRALEIVSLTGLPLAASRREWTSATSEFFGILLMRDRDEIRNRIAANVDHMFSVGILEEVRLAAHAGPWASRAIGFRDIQAHLRGESDLTTCRDAIVAATRKYAKRQLTWCRNQFNFPSIDLTATSAPIESALELLARSSA